MQMQRAGFTNPSPNHRTIRQTLGPSALLPTATNTSRLPLARALQTSLNNQVQHTAQIHDFQQKKGKEEERKRESLTAM